MKLHLKYYLFFIKQVLICFIYNEWDPKGAFIEITLTHIKMSQRKKETKQCHVLHPLFNIDEKMDEYNYDELNHIGVVYKDMFICST